MFGYISPDTPYLFKKDETLYKAVYCGLCKSIGRGCGQCARTTLTYDMAFVSALVHNIRGEDVKIEKKRCIVHWFRRRPVAEPDDVTVMLGCANTALAYFKLCDDKRDGEARGALRIFIRRGFKRARKKHPRIAEIIGEQTERQAELEKRGCASIDEAAEPTAQMMLSLSRYALGERASDCTDKLFYSLGKWVYIIDALDDFEKDVKKGGYNVLLNAYGLRSREEMTEKYGEELKFILDVLFADMREGLAGINFKFNHDLTDNIILRGIPLKSREIFYGKSCGSKGVHDEQKKS